MKENTYSTLARKYRPKYFSEVVGQPHVVRTLQNALSANKVAHAYMFSGPRGVGKTTIARLLARALNCTGAKDKDNFPCGQCEHCKEMDSGSSYVYREIDGASHRGIDQMRSIQEELSYSTVGKQWSVYVIDEVHMLTSEAFNAMLKSLEEPPDQIIFVLCTTESHRVPPTIASRTQHFRFRLLSIEEIKKVIADIFGKEGVAFEEEALFYIAKKASGSLRDAENISEQVLAYCTTDKRDSKETHRSVEVTKKKTLEALQIFSEDVVSDFLKRVAKGHDGVGENVLALTKLLSDGYQLVDFFYDFIERISNFLLYKRGITSANVLKVSESQWLHLKQNSDLFSERDLYLILDISFDFLKELRLSRDVDILGKLFLYKVHSYKQLVSSEEIRENLLHFASRVEKEKKQENKVQEPEKNEAVERKKHPAEGTMVESKRQSERQSEKDLRFEVFDQGKILE